MKNFFSIIKLLLDAIIEKTLPPTFSSRTLFIVPSTVIVGLNSICPNINLLEDYKLNYSHPTNIKLCKKQINLLIIYLSNKSLELLNNDLNSKIITKYLDENNLINNQIDFIEPKILQNIVYEMVYYYNQRNKDGWKDSNKQIKLVNDNFINPNQPIEPNDFVNIGSWCPLQGQKMLGSQWGKVKSILSPKQIELINKFLENEFAHVDIKSECKEVLDKSLVLSDKEKMIAEFWAGIGGSVTPPGFFNMFLYGYFKANPRSNLTQLKYFYKLNTGLFQASIIVWDVKYKYLQCRPIQSIRLEYPQIPIDYYFGQTTTDLWKPYQESRLLTPPFPDFISGHSTFSSTASHILTRLLGPTLCNLHIKLSKEEMLMLSPIFSSNEIECMDLTEIIIQPDSSKIQSNIPHEHIILQFVTWEEMAESAGISRIYGGIHYPSSNKIGFQVGQMIGDNLFL
jgi:hypothetical protein